MNDSANPMDELDPAGDAFAASPDDGSDDPEYEEICSDEVDRIVQALEELMSGVDSENIRAYLEEAADNIFALVYEDPGAVVIDSEEHSEQADDLAA